MNPIKRYQAPKYWAIAIIAALYSVISPPSAHAVVFTFSFDMSDFLVSISGPQGPYTPANITPGVLLTGTPAAPVLSIPQGASFELGVDISLSGPNQFGLDLFQMGLSDTNPAIAAVNASAGNGQVGSQRVGYGTNGNHGPVVNPFFVSINTTGRLVDGDNAGGVDDNLGMAGANVLGLLSNQTAYLYFGDQGPAELYNSLHIDSTGAAGTSDKFTATNLNTALNYIVPDAQSPGSYTGTSYSPTNDTIAPLPVLTLRITQAVPEPAAIAMLLIGTIILPRHRKTRANPA